MKHLNKLKELCKLSTHHQHKMSCIITKKNKIVSQGFNKIKTSPHSIHPYNMLHAEIDALLKLNGDAKGCTAYVYRERKDGSLGLSKPCPSCMKSLIDSGIKEVYYTVNGGWEKL